MYLIYVLVRLGLNGWDPAQFITAGDRYVQSSKTPTDIPVLKNSVGYDGHFFYRLALDPFPSQQAKYGVLLDRPAYRSQRVLYPLVAKALAVGNVGLIPTALIAVNLLAITFSAYLAGSLAQHYRGSPNAGLLAGFYPGLLLSVSRDLAEPLALALMLGSIMFLRNSKHVLATMLLTLAVLTRETSLLIAVAAGLIWLYYLRSNPSSIRERIPWFYFTLPVCVFVLWQVILWRTWGQFPVLTGTSSSGGPPSKGLFDAWNQVAANGGAQKWKWILEVILLFSIWGYALVSIKRSSASLLVKLAFVAYCLGCLVLTGAVWIEDWAFLRIATEASVFALIVLACSRFRLAIPMTAAMAAAWISLAINEVVDGPFS